MKKFFLIGLTSGLLAACSATPTFDASPDAEQTYDGLSPMKGTVLDAVWARTDIDVTGYNKVMLEGIGVEFRPVKGPYSGRGSTRSAGAMRSTQTEFPLDPDTQQLFIQEIRGAFVEELGKSEVFTLVQESGPDVLKLRIGLLDVLSRVPPETMGRSRIFLDSVGEATLVLELRESESNAILVRAVDRRAAERPGQAVESTRVTNAAEVRRLGRRWATILKDGLETLLSEGVSE